MHPRRHRRPLAARLGLVLALGLGLAAASAPATSRAANEPITIENVRVGFGDQYKIGQWSPVWVDLKAGPARYPGLLEIVVTDDDGTPTSWTRTVDVPAGQTVTVAAYARAGSRNAEFTVNVYDDAKKRRVRASKQTTPNGAIDPFQSLVVTMGQPRGVEEVPRVSSSPEDSTRDTQIVIAPARLPQGLPARWYGLEGVEALVIDTNDLNALGAVDSRSQAVREWVRNGGHLVVAVGGNWQQVLDSSLKTMLPALPAGQIRVSDLAGIESYAGGNSPITKVGENKTVNVTKLEVVAARGGRGLDATAPNPLVVRGHYGFGRVTVVGLDVDQKPFADWADKKAFWTRVLDLRRRGPEPVAGGGRFGGGAAFMQNAGSDASTFLHQKLEQFQGVKLVPFGYVAFFVFLYILLIGPGDYLFLKKVLKRMELTWVTFPLIVVGVSLLAYVAAYAVKGTDLRINKVDLVDVDQADGVTRGSTWFTVFSPQNRDYTVQVKPLALDRDPKAGGDAPAKSSNETLVTWFGAPEGTFSMGSPNRMSLASAAYSYEPTEQAERLEGVRVPIWTTKSFNGRWFATSAPVVVEAKLSLGGSEFVTGDITNVLEQTLKNAVLVYKERVYDLGDLAKGKTKSLSGVTVKNLAVFLDGKRLNIPDSVNNPWQPDNRLAEVSESNMVWSLMFNDSASASGKATTNHALHVLDMTSQVKLDRPVLVAELDAEAVRIDLGRTTSPPQMKQTTIVRVILGGN